MKAIWKVVNDMMAHHVDDGGPWELAENRQFEQVTKAWQRNLIEEASRT